MERSEYLAAIRLDPSVFPAVDGCPDPPPDWVAAAWETPAVQDAIVGSIARDVSKCGELSFACTDEFIARLAATLTTEQVVRFYHALRDESPHREAEFRTEFLAGFARHAAALPPALTWRALVAAIGDDATAAELLGAEPGKAAGYSFRLVPAEPERTFHLHRGADHALHVVFARRGGPLRFAVAGEEVLHGDYDDPPGPDVSYAARVAPETARQVAAALAALPIWRVFELLRALDRRLLQYKAGRDLYTEAYRTVQGAYAAAASAGAAVEVRIG